MEFSEKLFKIALNIIFVVRDMQNLKVYHCHSPMSLFIELSRELLSFFEKWVRHEIPCLLLLMRVLYERRAEKKCIFIFYIILKLWELDIEFGARRVHGFKPYGDF